MIRIAMEGIDGSGKSTQVGLFCGNLKGLVGMEKVKLYHEPRKLRSRILKECEKTNVNDLYISYLFGIDGYLNRTEEIDDLNHSLDLIYLIRDRDTAISHYAYHHDLGTPDEMTYLISYMVNKINSVDLVFFLDVSIEVALSRIDSRLSKKNNYFEFPEKLEKIRDNYVMLLNDKKKQKLMGFNKDLKICIIDGSKDKYEVYEQINLEFEKFLKGV